MNPTFIYAVCLLAVFALGIGLGAFIESRRISGLRLDEFLGGFNAKAVSLEVRLARVEDDAIALRRYLEDPPDAGATQQLRTVREDSYYG